MTQRTIARMFETSDAAHAAVRSLEGAGFAHVDITYMGNRSGVAAATDPYDSSSSNVVKPARVRARA